MNFELRNQKWEEEYVNPGDWVHIIFDLNQSYEGTGWNALKVYRVRREVSLHKNCVSFYEFDDSVFVHRSWVKKVEPLVAYMLNMENNPFAETVSIAPEENDWERVYLLGEQYRLKLLELKDLQKKYHPQMDTEYAKLGAQIEALQWVQDQWMRFHNKD